MAREDVARVAELEAATFSTPWKRETFEALLGREAVQLTVCETPDAGLVGYAVVWCVVDQGELANLAVAEEVRRTGLGARLLAAVLERARSCGVREMFLEVRVSNEAALRLYRAHGFLEVGRRSGYYDRPREDALVLRAEL